jgi:outer membrane protein OmpA-like peptidoglycan-associated protein
LTGPRAWDIGFDRVSDRYAKEGPRTMTRTASEAGRGLRAAVARRLAAPLLAGVLSLALGACSAVPDWADPTDWFEADQAPTTISTAGAEESKDADFPNLASVPDAPPRVLSAEARGQLHQDLAADRANAEYSGQRLTGEQAAAGKVAPGAGAAVEGAPVVPKIAATLTKAPATPEPKTAMAAPAVQTAQATQTAQAAQTSEAAAPAKAKPKTQLKFPQFKTGGAAASQAMPAPAMPAPAERSELVGVIYFTHGSAALNKHDRGVLRQVAALHRQRGGGVRVIGHASARTGTVDAATHSSANLEMSMRRAKAVRAALVSLGVTGEKVTAEARGDSQPVYHEFMPTGEAGNRRTEIFLEY